MSSPLKHSERWEGLGNLIGFLVTLINNNSASLSLYSSLISPSSAIYLNIILPIYEAAKSELLTNAFYTICLLPFRVFGGMQREIRRGRLGRWIATKLQRIL
jgi:hypothetical protein